MPEKTSRPSTLRETHVSSVATRFTTSLSGNKGVGGLSGGGSFSGTSAGLPLSTTGALSGETEGWVLTGGEDVVGCSTGGDEAGLPLCHKAQIP